jgi:uncharacterized protein YfaS (alpha-2-macroglobulin family)
MYRPGQTVYFRGVARQAFNGRYEMPPLNNIPLILRDANGVQLSNYDMQLSPYGTFNGEFKLSEEAVPGYYTIENSPLEFYFSFQVAEYRKPEINLKVDFSAGEIQLSDAERATANVEARYFFDAPVNDVEVHWLLYAKPDTFYLPNYETSLVSTSWQNVFGFASEFGRILWGNSLEKGRVKPRRRGLYPLGCQPSLRKTRDKSSPWR